MRRKDRFRVWAALPVMIVLACVVATSSAEAPHSADKVGQVLTAEVRAAKTTIARLPVVQAGSGFATAADYSLPWYSFNGGGVIEGSSPTQGLGSSIGQSVVGRGVSADYDLELGFWAGSAVCSCRDQGDYDDDGFVTALDLGAMIDILFAGAPDIRDPNCPTTRLDYWCDGFSDALDLGAFIDYMFAGGAPPCEPCTDL